MFNVGLTCKKKESTSRIWTTNNNTNKWANAT